METYGDQVIVNLVDQTGTEEDLSTQYQIQVKLWNDPPKDLQ
jgi:hypothetical protein